LDFAFFLAAMFTLREVFPVDVEQAPINPSRPSARYQQGPILCPWMSVADGPSERRGRCAYNGTSVSPLTISPPVTTSA
jgi:hypothetical protein